MGIPRKHSRPVEVDGQKFRYMIGEVAPGPNQPLDEREIKLTAQEDAEKPGRVLQVLLPYGFSVGPEQVRSLIRQGLKDGWKPSERGAAYNLAGYTL